MYICYILTLDVIYLEKKAISEERLLPEQRAPVPPVGRKTAASGREEKRNKPREYGGQGEKKTGAQRGGREHTGEVSDVVC